MQILEVKLPYQNNAHKCKTMDQIGWFDLVVHLPHAYLSLHIKILLHASRKHLNSLF